MQAVKGKDAHGRKAKVRGPRAQPGIILQWANEISIACKLLPSVVRVSKPDERESERPHVC